MSLHTNQYSVDETFSIELAARVRSGQIDAEQLKAHLPKASDRWRDVLIETAKTGPKNRGQVFRRLTSEWPDYVQISERIAQVQTGKPLAEALEAAQTARSSYAVTARELLEAADPKPMIGGHLLAGSLIAMYGAPKTSLKTFAALDLAVSVATGTPWFGIAALEVATPGQVVYVAGEGIGGLKARFNALRARRGDDWLGRLHVVKQSVNLLDQTSLTALDVFIGDLVATGPVQLLAIDTFARALHGADENSSRDIGAAIAALDQIRAKYGCTILLVHHTGKANADARGSSALLGAVDTMLKLSGDGSTTRIVCEAQKEMVPFDPIVLRLVEVEGTGSCVLELADYRDRRTEATPSSEQGKRAVLEGLERIAIRGIGVSTTNWKAEVEEAGGPKGGGFYRYKKQLVEDDGLVELADSTKGGSTWQVSAEGYAYLGLEIPGSGTPKNSQLPQLPRTPNQLPTTPMGATTGAVGVESSSRTPNSHNSHDSRSGSGGSSVEPLPGSSGREKRNPTVEVVNAADGVEELP